MGSSAAWYQPCRLLRTSLSVSFMMMLCREVEVSHS
jgi:hypothetical protein